MTHRNMFIIAAAFALSTWTTYVFLSSDPTALVEQIILHFPDKTHYANIEMTMEMPSCTRVGVGRSYCRKCWQESGEDTDEWRSLCRLGSSYNRTALIQHNLADTTVLIEFVDGSSRRVPHRLVPQDRYHWTIHRETYSGDATEMAVKLQEWNLGSMEMESVRYHMYVVYREYDMAIATGYALMDGSRDHIRRISDDLDAMFDTNRLMACVGSWTITMMLTVMVMMRKTGRIQEPFGVYCDDDDDEKMKKMV
jgi:hypothetical protein